MAAEAEKAPRILSLKWGRMEIEGLEAGKDFKLWPGGGRDWDWSEHGTGHWPGIQAGDCRELVEHGSRVVILSRGMLCRLKISPQALAYLQEEGIEVICQSTKKAVQTYNRLVGEGRPVGGLFHSTC